MGSVQDDRGRAKETEELGVPKSVSLPSACLYLPPLPVGWAKMTPLSPCEEPVRLASHTGAGPDAWAHSLEA